ncbi:MAG: FRG domain-containing protein [Rhodothermaceae bacterium]|nr:FRG domain-containing protein [Rhodothermaceae bacterium]
MSQEEVEEPSYISGSSSDPAWRVYRAESVSEFLDLLLASAEQWLEAGRGDIVYRGQAESSWGLVPRAFRESEFDEGNGNMGQRRVGRQASAEFKAVHEFLIEADAAGLGILERGVSRLIQEDPAILFGSRDWQKGWPQEEVWEAIALAQHHGVVTRFLDFTENGLVAAFWAAFDAWKRRDDELEAPQDPQIAVWVVDLRFIRAINAVSKQFPERIAVIRVPRGNNAYLHAQEGLFLIDRGANDVLTFEKELSMENVIVKRARYWHSGDLLEQEGITRSWFGEVPIAQVCLPVECVLDLLKELRTRGITVGRLMPSLDRVVEALKIDREIAKAE